MPLHLGQRSDITVFTPNLDLCFISVVNTEVDSRLTITTPRDSYFKKVPAATYEFTRIAVSEIQGQPQ